MMDFSVLSTHESSMYAPDKSQSYLQSYEIDSQFSEYSNIIDYQSTSKIVEICSEFREITKKGHTDNNYLQMIKNYLLNLQNYLDCTVKNIGSFTRNNDSNSNTIPLLIHNEIKTWRLIYNLYEDRFNNATNDSTIHKIRFSELQLVDDLFKSNASVREAQIVVDWLEEYTKERTEKDVNFLIGAHGKSWEHTKHNIRIQDHFRGVANCGLKELDPDAPLRGHLTLSESDKADENEYLRYLFHCLQSGDSEKALALCQSHDEWWRALSLEGWKPFHNPLVREDHIRFGNKDLDVTGNPNRDLYKSVCWQLSEDAELNIHERAIYAIFCGNIRVLSLVQKDWEGLLWSYFKAYIEQVVDEHVHTLTNNGTHGTQSLQGGSDDYLDVMSSKVESLLMVRGGGGVGSMRALSLEQIFDDIAAKLVHSPTDIVNSGTRHNTKTQPLFYQAVFEVVQQFIILNDIVGLLGYIEVAISKLPSKMISSTADDKLILRFLAHVVIFVFSIHVDMKMDIYHRVLEHYIESLLTDHNSIHDTAFYIARLSTDLQAVWFSKYMIAVNDDRSAGIDQKRHCVQEGIQHDIDVVTVSRRVVRTIALVQHSVDDTARIGALDWLTFMPEQQPHLLRLANGLCRSFLEEDKLHCAQMTLSKVQREIIGALGANVIGSRWLRSSVYEFQCLDAFHAAHDAFGNWYQHFSSEKPSEFEFNAQQDLNKFSFQEKQMFQRKYEEHALSVLQWEKINDMNAKKVMELFLKTLKMGQNGWLSDVGQECDWDEDIGVEGDANISVDNDVQIHRQAQIVRLQKKHIVRMFFMLVKVLSSSKIDEKCFELIDILADDELKLFKHFEKEELQRLLQKIRQCSLHLMAASKDSLGIEM